MDHLDNDIRPGESEEKRKERLERNREIARNCRKRKRERTSALEQEVVQLRERNRELELKLKLRLNELGKATTGRAGRDEEAEAHRLKQVDAMIHVIANKKSFDKELSQRLIAYEETYSDYGKERKELVGVHMQQLKQLMSPTQVSKMMLWLLEQDQSFYEDGNTSSVWHMVCESLKLDKRQQKKLLKIRGDDIDVSCKVLKMITALEHEVSEVMKRRKNKMRSITSIITPVQQARFLQWVEKNQACIHMLNTLWIKADAVESPKELEELKHVG